MPSGEMSAAVTIVAGRPGSSPMASRPAAWKPPTSSIVMSFPASTSAADARSTRDRPLRFFVMTYRSPSRGSTNSDSASDGPSGYRTVSVSTSGSVAPVPFGAASGSAARYTVTCSRADPLSPMSAR